MYVLGYFFGAVAKVLDYGLSIFMWLIIARAILSWVNPDPYNTIVRFINQVTEPVLSQIRRRIPVVYGGMDFSPVIAIGVVIFVQAFVVASLTRLAYSLS